MYGNNIFIFVHMVWYTDEHGIHVRHSISIINVFTAVALTVIS